MRSRVCRLRLQPRLVPRHGNRRHHPRRRTQRPVLWPRHGFSGCCRGNRAGGRLVPPRQACAASCRRLTTWARRRHPEDLGDRQRRPGTLPCSRYPRIQPPRLCMARRPSTLANMVTPRPPTARSMKSWTRRGRAPRGIASPKRATPPFVDGIGIDSSGRRAGHRDRCSGALPARVAFHRPHPVPVESASRRAWRSTSVRVRFARATESSKNLSPRVPPPRTMRYTSDPRNGKMTTATTSPPWPIRTARGHGTIAHDEDDQADEQGQPGDEERRPDHIEQPHIGKDHGVLL